MKITRALTLATAACLSTGAAFAAPTSETFVSGTGTLDFQSNYLRQNQLLLVATVSKIIDPASAPPNTASYNTNTKTVTLNFDRATVSESTGQVSLSASNSRVELYLRHESIDVDENGDPALVLGMVTLQNISFDLGNAAVYADVSTYFGSSILESPLVRDVGRLMVFQGSAPVTDGTQGLVVDGLVSGSTVLRLTTQAADIVINGIYMEPPSTIDHQASLYQMATLQDWAVASASGTFTSAVPEASTMSLMLIGLMPIVALGRRARG
jgi:hypothetical protein